MSVAGKSPGASAGTGGMDGEQFDWVGLRADMNAASIGGETGKEKLIRKISDNPFVPIGCLATVTALSVGLWSFRQGKRQMSQQMMRARIAAQGFTVIALIAGVMMTTKSLEK